MNRLKACDHSLMSSAVSSRSDGMTPDVEVTNLLPLIWMLASWRTAASRLWQKLSVNMYRGMCSFQPPSMIFLTALGMFVPSAEAWTPLDLSGRCRYLCDEASWGSSAEYALDVALRLKRARPRAIWGVETKVA